MSGGPKYEKVERVAVISHELEDIVELKEELVRLDPLGVIQIDGIIYDARNYEEMLNTALPPTIMQAFSSDYGLIFLRYKKSISVAVESLRQSSLPGFPLYHLYRHSNENDESLKAAISLPVVSHELERAMMPILHAGAQHAYEQHALWAEVAPDIFRPYDVRDPARST